MRGQNKYFVLTAADAHSSRLYLPSAVQLAKYRLDRKEWGLKTRTRHRKQMKTGDRVLIYISGRRELSQHFIAEATIASDPTRNFDCLIDSPKMETSICSEFKVTLKNVRLFRNPVPVRDLLKRFDFVAESHRKMWRIYFQGGAVRLSRKDFQLVLRKERSRRSERPPLIHLLAPTSAL
jgi:hypothetical protein